MTSAEMKWEIVRRLDGLNEEQLIILKNYLNKLITKEEAEIALQKAKVQDNTQKI